MTAGRIAFTRIIKLYGDFGTLFCYEAIQRERVLISAWPFELASQFVRKLKGELRARKGCSLLVQGDQARN